MAFLDYLAHAGHLHGSIGALTDPLDAKWATYLAVGVNLFICAMYVTLAFNVIFGFSGAPIWAKLAFISFLLFCGFHHGGIGHHGSFGEYIPSQVTPFALFANVMQAISGPIFGYWLLSNRLRLGAVPDGRPNSTPDRGSSNGNGG